MSNYMTSQPRKQTVTTHILPKILRSKDSLLPKNLRSKDSLSYNEIWSINRI